MLRPRQDLPMGLHERAAERCLDKPPPQQHVHNKPRKASLGLWLAPGPRFAIWLSQFCETVALRHAQSSALGSSVDTSRTHCPPLYQTCLG